MSHRIFIERHHRRARCGLGLYEVDDTVMVHVGRFRGAGGIAVILETVEMLPVHYIGRQLLRVDGYRQRIAID